MNTTQITFLGTTACIFDKNDDTPSFVINDKYLFDTGFALVNNLVNHNYMPTDIQYLFFTHMHHDHYVGLPSLLFYYVQTGADLTKLKIIGPKNDVRRIVEKAVEFLEIPKFWKNAGMPEIIETEGGDTFETEDMLFETVCSHHPVQGLCYRMTDKNTGKVICATGDTAVNDALPEFFKNCDALIHEISLGCKENTPGFVHPSGHSTISEAIKLASEVKTKKLFFVHSSRQTANHAVVLANQRVAGLEAINPIIGEKYRID
jgi:ribonuclease Z